MQSIPNVDAAALKRSLGDIVALSTLTAVWSGAKPLRIAESLGSALYSMLGAKLVHVVLTDASGQSLARIARTGHNQSSVSLDGDLDEALLQWTRTRDPHELYPYNAAGTDGPMRISCRQLGHNAELGFIAAGFAPGQGPTSLDHLLLDVSATQATTGLTNALLVESLRQSQARSQDQTMALEALNRTAATTALEKDLGDVVQTVTDAGVELSGAAFGAFFYNVTDDAGESYMLYALSGVPKETFDGFPMPRNTQIFAPTFSGQGVIRSDDIRSDPRYGQNAPHAGMPKGHLPVRSYLAAPVKSRGGEVLGGLFFGHPEVGQFTEEHEARMIGLAAQAAIAIDNTLLFKAVQTANETLEQRVVERTQALNDAHEALRQAQKMEAVGQLTGGIAHDFNNMLAVVMGSLELLNRRLPEEDARNKYLVASASDSARRAANLTQRLLAFSRQQPLQPETIDINQLVSGMSDLLRHSLGAEVRLETILAADVSRVHIDPNQMENVILNLSVNARDAMADGGRLTIETQNAQIDERYAASEGIAAGPYVLMAVSDTGSGMPADVIAKAFDPFFTTKEVGKGTGLGLSQVYGFVNQSGGHIKIYSTIGQGTTIKIYLPRDSEIGQAEAIEPDAPTVPLGDKREVVLVVDDEPAVRAFSVAAFEELGYKVLSADSARTALQVLSDYPDIALLFTDIVMPDVNGRKLADMARVMRPGLKVLYTTGYTRDAVVRNGVVDRGVELIGKPFAIDDLAVKARTLLDQY
ncbi:MAG: ATP-binding protein [Asticcacaulis sp.]